MLEMRSTRILILSMLVHLGLIHYFLYYKLEELAVIGLYHFVSFDSRESILPWVLGENAYMFNTPLPFDAQAQVGHKRRDTTYMLWTILYWFTRGLALGVVN